MRTDSLPSGKFQDQKNTGMAAAILALGLILIFWRYLFVSPTPLIYPVSELGGDLNREVWPLARYLVQAIQDGDPLPLWRTYHLSGAPVAGHPVAPVFYPPVWICLFLPLPLALNLLVLSHLWWAGMGVFAFLQDSGRLRWEAGLPALRWEACLSGALVFALAPRWIAFISGGHWHAMMAMAWWPWAWWAFARYWRTGRQARHAALAWGIVLGVCLAAQALTYGQYLYISLASLAVATLGLFRWKAKLDWLWGAARLWLSAGVTSLGLSAVQILPFLELLPHSSRLGLSGEVASTFSLPIALVIGVLFPPSLKFPEWYLYAGIGALLFTTWGLGSKLTRMEKIAWVALGAGLLLSFGSNTPIYGALLRSIPGFGLFRIPTRWWLLALSGLAVLSGWGVEKWLGGRQEGKPARRQTIALVALGTVYLTLGALKLFLPAAVPFDTPPAVVVLVLIMIFLLHKPSQGAWIALTLVILLDSWIASRGLIQPVLEEHLLQPGEVDSLLDGRIEPGERILVPYLALPAADLVANGLEAMDGYDSFQLTGYARLVHRAIGCDYNGYAVSIPATQTSPEAVQACPELRLNRGLLAALNTRYLLLPAGSDQPEADRISEGETHWLYDLGQGVGRGFGVAQVLVSTPRDCFDRLATIDARSGAVVESPPPFEIDASPTRVQAFERTPNQERFLIQSDGATLFVRSESWAPGWQVSVDGQDRTLVRADCALQGVWLEAGSHEIVFEYAPRGYQIGQAISLISLSGLFGAILVSIIKRMRPRPSGAEQE